VSTEAALLSAIADDPDDDTARLVFADFLDEKGTDSDSARAKFIRAQVELARPAQRGESARRRELLSEAKKLSKQYGAQWAAPVFDALGTKDEPFWREVSYDSWDRGFFDWLNFDNLKELRKRLPAVRALTPITVVTLWHFNDADVRKLARMPEMNTVKTLSLCGDGFDDSAKDIGDETATTLAESPHLTRLETLSLIQNRLTNEGVRAIAHSGRLTRLAKLHLYGNQVNNDTYAMLAASPLGRRMTEWSVDGSFAVNAAAARILARATHLTHITSLSFSNTDMTDDGVEALAKAEHLSGLTELDFRCTNITHQGVRALARSRVFANLERLNFVKTWINGFGARFLRESPYLKKIKFLALYDAVPEASQKKLRARFGRKVEFGRV
jgi:uncharacterized protein (TIGR02996 family)